jgi:hypothetical protein
MMICKRVDIHPTSMASSRPEIVITLMVLDRADPLFQALKRVRPGSAILDRIGKVIVKALTDDFLSTKVDEPAGPECPNPADYKEATTNGL